MDAELCLNEDNRLETLGSRDIFAKDSGRLVHAASTASQLGCQLAEKSTGKIRASPSSRPHQLMQEWYVLTVDRLNQAYDAVIAPSLPCIKLNRHMRIHTGEPDFSQISDQV